MKELQRDIEYLVSEELIRANKKNPLFHSDHEAFDVIDKEAMEVIDETELIIYWCKRFRALTYRDGLKKFKSNSITNMKNAAIRCACEAVQVAAMCDKWAKSKEVSDE